MSGSTVAAPKSSKEDRNIATLVHAGGILFGFLPSLIAYYGASWAPIPFVRGQ